jgi:hypothetical protein
MKEVVRAVNLDAGESMFFARQLEYIKQQSYDILYPEYKAITMIPVSTEAGPGAESITYREFDTVGIMKVISNYADDLPRADVRGKEYTTPVRSIGGSYGYNVQEIRAARMANKPLELRRAEAARRAYEQMVNRIGWFAKSDDGIYGGLTGLLYNANITKADANTGDWVNPGTTADQIIYDFSTAFFAMVSLTKGVEWPDTILIPPKQYGRLRTLPRSTISDTTVMTFLMNAHPEIKQIEWVNELSGISPKPSTPTAIGAGGTPYASGYKTDAMVMYKKDPMKLTYEIPQPFEQFPVQERGLEYLIPTHARVGGVICYYPLSLAIVEKIGSDTYH